MHRQIGVYDAPPSPSRVIFPSEVRQDSGVNFGNGESPFPPFNGYTKGSLRNTGYEQEEYFPSSSRELQERVPSAAPQAQFNSPAHNFTQHLRERSPSSSSALLNLLQRYPSARQSVYSGRIFEAEARPVDRQLFRPADASTGYPLVEVAVPKQTAAEIQHSFSGPSDHHFPTYSNGYSIPLEQKAISAYSSNFTQHPYEGYGQTFPRSASDFGLRISDLPHTQRNYNGSRLDDKHLLQRNNWPEELDIDSLFAEDAMSKSTAEWKNSFAQVQDRFRQKPGETEDSTVLLGFASSGGQARGISVLTKSCSHNEIHDKSLLGHAISRAQEAPEFRRSGALDNFWSATVNNRPSSPTIHRIPSNLTAAERLQLLQEPIDGPNHFSAPIVPQRLGSKTALAARREQYLHEATSPSLTLHEQGNSQPTFLRSTPNFSDLDNAVQELQSGIRQTSYSQGARRLGGCGRFPTDETNLSPPRIVSRKYTPSPTDTSESSSVYQVPNGLPHPKPKHNIKEQIYQAGIQSNFFPRMGLRTNTNFPVPSTGSVASRITEFERRPGTPTLHIANNHKQIFDSGPMSPRSTVFRSKPVIHIDIGSTYHRPSQQATTVFSFEPVSTISF